MEYKGFEFHIFVIVEDPAHYSRQNCNSIDMSKIEKKAKLIGSEDYIDALQSIQQDPYDTSSWLLLLDEVEGGRGGEVTFPDTVTRFLQQFPRASSAIVRLASYYELQHNDLKSAEEVCALHVSDMRDVSLWEKYIDIVNKQATQQKKSGLESTDSIAASREKLEKIYDDAIDNVGVFINSGTIWKAYVEFIQNWPDASGMDPAKKLNSLRRVFQRSFVVPHDELDFMWTNYEAFERAQGDQAAKEIIPEFEKRYLSSKALVKDRKKLVNKISFQRLATPPAKSLAEIDQLRAWDSWIKYELSNPYNLSEDALHDVMQAIFRSCLCHFRYHAEIWLSFAGYQLDADHNGNIISFGDAFFVGDTLSLSNSADNEEQFMEKRPKTSAKAKDLSYNLDMTRSIYLEAMEVIPNSTALRIAYAEMEEVYGSLDTSRSTLRTAFERLTSELTFTVLQRFIRRHDGLLAARKFFSETQVLRSHRRIGFGIFMANAKLELEGNNQPEIAVKVLELARKNYTVESHSLEYIQLLVRALLRMGDLQQIQWIMNAALGKAGARGVFSFHNASSSLVNVNGKGDDSENADVNGDDINNSNDKNNISVNLSLGDQLELWEDYLHIETTIGVSSTRRLNELRRMRDYAMEDLKQWRKNNEALSGTGIPATIERSTETKRVIKSIYEFPSEIITRYHEFTTSMPENERNLVDRSAREMIMEGDGKISNTLGSIGGKKDDDALSLPPKLKLFINNLQPHTGPMPDIDGFLRHFKGLVLPPRPSQESIDNDSGVGAKRNASDWLTQAAEDNEDGDNIDYEMNDEPNAARDDIFRMRKRQKRLTY